MIAWCSKYKKDVLTEADCYYCAHEQGEKLGTYYCEYCIENNVNILLEEMYQKMSFLEKVKVKVKVKCCEVYCKIKYPELR